MVFQSIYIRQVPWKVLKTAAFGFQHFPRELANVNAWKNMFDPYIAVYSLAHRGPICEWLVFWLQTALESFVFVSSEWVWLYVFLLDVSQMR